MPEPTWSFGAIRAASECVRCHEDVTRGGESEPCHKVAVALKRDHRDSGPYPVCKFHARGEGMVSLREIWTALTNA